jgi:hypothetical protein
MPDQAEEGDLDILIQTAINDPLAIGLAENLLREAGIPFFAMDRNVGHARRVETFSAGGTFACQFEAEARAILHTVEKLK